MKQKYLATIVILFGCALSIAWHVSVSAQPKPDPNAVFPVETLILKTGAGDFEFSVEIADDDVERQQGLMFRKTMLPTHGMLFEFETTQVIYMWMENTVLPLDMLFIRPNGTVARIEENTTPFSRRIIASGEPVSHVLELNAGMARQISAAPGDVVAHRFFESAK